MSKYLIHCTTGFCGVDEDVVIEADDEQMAENSAAMWWDEKVEISVSVVREISQEEIDNEGYEEIE